MSSPLLVTLETREHHSYFPALNGVRVLALIWIVSYHIAVQGLVFGDLPAFLRFWAHPIFRYTGFVHGEVAVDVFFILTGFLLAHPIFWAEAHKKPGEELPKISVREYLGQRMSRIYPTYLFAIVLFTCVLNDPIADKAMDYDKMPMGGYAAMYREHYPNATHGPTFRELVPIHLVFLNNFLPFGGCMMVTWSLCIQVQFYLLFPHLINKFGRGKRLLKAIFIMALCGFAWRLAIWHLIVAPQRPCVNFAGTLEELRKFGTHFMWWYEATPLRMPGVFAGVLLAYAIVQPQTRAFLSSLRQRHVLRTALTAIAFWSVSVAVSIDLDSMWQMLFFNVGGWAWLLSACFLFALLLVDNGLDPVSRALNKLLSLRLWALLSLPTYAVYLTHMSIAARLVQSVFWPVVFDFPHLLYYLAVVHTCSWTVGVLAHRFIEVPVDKWLNKKRRTQLEQVGGSGSSGGSSSTNSSAANGNSGKDKRN